MSVDYAEILDTLQERSQEGRDLVFRHVADLFLSGNAPRDPVDRSKLSEILRILRPKVNLGIRRELSGHLYSMESPPLELLDILLEDVDSVSGPLLDYAAIPPASLNRLIDHAPIEVVSRLKRRKDLSAAVQDRLNERFRQPPHPQPEPARARKTLEELAKNRLADPVSTQLTVPPAPAPRRERQITAADVYPDTDDLALASADIDAQKDVLRDFTRISSEWQWETDRQGKLIYLSDTASRALGRPVSTLVEQPFSELIAAVSNGTSDRGTALAHALERRSAFDDVTFTADKQSTPQMAPVTWEVAGVPKFNLDTGRFLGYRGMARPLPDFKALQAPANGNNPPEAQSAGSRIAQARTTDHPAGGKPLTSLEVAETVQSLSHELRTPLNAILGFSEMIQLETWGKINEKYKESVTGIIEAAQHLYELINDILENAKLRQQLDELYPKSFSISSVLNEAIEAVAPQAARRHVTLTAEDQGLRAIAYSDVRLVHYSLVRLLRCALNTCTENSVITITVQNRQDGYVIITFAFKPSVPIATPSHGRQHGNPALYEFCMSLAKELARAIGASILEEQPDSETVALGLSLPPHERFPARPRA